MDRSKPDQPQFELNRPSWMRPTSPEQLAREASEREIAAKAHREWAQLDNMPDLNDLPD